MFCIFAKYSSSTTFYLPSMKHLFTLLLASVLFQTSYSQTQKALDAQIFLQNPTNSPHLCEGSELWLMASPAEQGLTYEWYRNGELYQTSPNATLRLREAGTYYVKISDDQREGISEKINVSSCPNSQAEIEAIWKQAMADVTKKPIDPPTTANSFVATVTSQNPVLCNGNTSAMLVAFPQGNQYSYQWQRANCLTCTYSTQSGLTNDTITTTTTGFWRVLVTQNTTTATSNPLRVASTAYATLTDQSDNPNGIVNISAGQSTSLKVSFVGQGPYMFSYNDGTSIRSMTTSSNPHILTVTPDQNRRYTLSVAGNTTCGTSSGDLVGNVRVVIDPTTSVLLPTPNSLNVCAGSNIEIPYTTVGTWAGARSLIVRLIDESDGSSITSWSGQSASPLQITVPSSLLPNRQFRANVLPVMPASVAGPVISSYIFTVTSTGCLAKPIVTASPANPNCGSVSLSSSNPTSSTATYQWVRDGVAIAGATSWSFTATQAGNYYVRVTNASVNYNDSSAVLPVSILGGIINITSPNTVICGSNTSAVLTANVSVAGGTFQWFRNDALISGATNATHTATTTGTYRVEYSIQGCAIASSISVTTFPLVTFTTLSGATSANVPANQPVQLRATFTGQGPWNYSLWDGSNLRSFTTTTNPVIFSVTPAQNTSYSVTASIVGCSNGGGSNIILLTVDPTTTLTLPAPSNLNVCAGETIEIPYTTVGTWAGPRALWVELNTASGSYISNSYQAYFSENPIRYTLPSTLAQGSTFRIRVGANAPSVSSVQSSYLFTVANTGCTPTATIRFSNSNVGCNVGLNASPTGSGYIYQWYRDDTPFGAQTSSSSLTVTQSGNYKVQVTNIPLNYNSTSANSSLTVMGFMGQITQDVNTCGTAILNATPADTALYTYRWRDNKSNPIAGATSPTFITNVADSYSVIITQKTGIGCAATVFSSYVSTNGVARITDTNGNTWNTLNISPGQSVTLRVTMTGQAPYAFDWSDGVNRRRVTTNNSVHEFTVTPSQNTRYSIFDYSNNCGFGNTEGQVSTVIDLSTSVTLPAPANLNVCAGGTVEIPFTTVGTWTPNRLIYITLLNASGSSIATWAGPYESPFRVRLPSNLALNSTYRILISGIAPFFNNVTSSYVLTVTSTGCQAAPIISINTPWTCNAQQLFGNGSVNGIAEWYRNGTLVQAASSNNTYTATESGSYTLRVIGSNGYDQTSSAVIVNLSIPNATISTTGSFCTNGVNYTLNSTVTDPAYTYQWYFAPNGNSPFLPVNGGNSPSLTTNIPGSYYLVYENGTCQGRSNTFNTCFLLLDYRSSTICQGGSIRNITFVNNNWTLSDNVSTLRLVDATTGVVVINNLATLTGFNSTFTNISLPSSVPAGSYRFVVTMTSPGATSPWSSGILTVMNNQAPNAPTVAAIPTTFTSGQSVSLTASNCTGTVTWQDNLSTSTTRTIVPTATTTYFATCTDANGCVSAPGSTTVSWNCDPLEPNNTFQTATLITTATYTSPNACLDRDTDQDWYLFVHNNLPYLIQIVPSCNTCTGSYQISVSVSNDTLIVRPTSVSGGTTTGLNTILYSYDNGTSTSFLARADFFFNYVTLRYKLPAPCPQNLSLYSTILDIAPNQTNTARATRITATNKVGNGATANYFGQNSVLLNPGFETQLNTGGTFRAEVRGCND